MKDTVISRGRLSEKAAGKKGQVMMEKQVRNVETFKLVLLGPGQLFGDDDVLFNRPYSSTIVCRSNQGTVIRMNGHELLKKMRTNEECWKLFQRYIINKEAMVRLRLNKIDYVFHKEPVKFDQEEIAKSQQSKNAGQNYTSIVIKKSLNSPKRTIENVGATHTEFKME